MQAERAPFLRIALVAAIALGSFTSFAIHRVRESDDAAVAKRKTETAAELAVRNAQAAKNELDKLMLELDELDYKVAQAITAIAEAENDADRAAAKARLRQWMQQQYEMKQQAAASRAVAHRGARTTRCCMCVPRQCIENPLAKGCL
jgi:hypothetical protein